MCADACGIDDCCCCRMASSRILWSYPCRVPSTTPSRPLLTLFTFPLSCRNASCWPCPTLASRTCFGEHMGEDCVFTCCSEATVVAKLPTSQHTHAASPSPRTAEYSTSMNSRGRRCPKARQFRRWTLSRLSRCRKAEASLSFSFHFTITSSMQGSLVPACNIARTPPPSSVMQVRSTCDSHLVRNCTC